MDFIEAVNFVAAIVTIVGGVTSITRALRQMPQPPTSGGMAPARAPPSAAPRSKGAAAVGVRYGLVLMIAAIFVSVVNRGVVPALYQQGGVSVSTVLNDLTYLAVAILFAVAGLLPARRTGSIGAGLIAAVLVAVGLPAGQWLYDVFYAPESIEGNVVSGVFLGLVGTIVLSGIAALVGRWAYRRSIMALAPVSPDVR
jgi:hypothetical protein